MSRRRPRPSLRRRLALGMAVGLVVVLVPAGLLLGDRLRQVVETYVLERLNHDLESLVAGLRLTPGAEPSLDSQRLTLVYHQPYSGHYFQLKAGEQLLRSRSLWDSALPVPDVALGERRVLHGKGPGRQHLLLLVRGVEKAGVPVVVAVAEDLGPLDQALRSVYGLLAAVAGAVLIALLVVQRGLLDLGLRPLARLRGQLRALARGEQSRLDMVGVPVEVRPLVEQINRLLALQAKRLERSRKGLGNLAHALKTPLTLLDRLAEEPALREQPAVTQAIARHVSEMRRIVDRELRRARLAGGGVPGQAVDLEQTVPALLQTLRTLYAERDLVLEAHLQPGLRFHGDREDLLELLGVLLDNACRHARHRVSIRALADGAGLRLRIEDDGPGVPAELRDSLVERGRRLDESQPGSGLGLAIASDIVEQYRGRLVLGPAGLGGLQVELWFPAPEA